MLGSNVPTRGGLPVGFKYANEWECECIQIYITPSRTWNVPSLTEDEVSKFRSAWDNSGVRSVVGHVPYLVNLASLNSDIRNKSVSRLIIEIDRAERFGIPYLVLHPGSNPIKKKGIVLIAKGLNRVFDSFNNLGVKVLLETFAGQGNSIGSRFEEMVALLEKVQRPEHIGICFDTCHVFSAGYDLRGYEGYEKILRNFDETVGLTQLKAIHLNDSKVTLGSRVDRHASVGEGNLGLQVFHAIVRDNRFVKIPKILEIPERDRKSKYNLVLLRKLRKREDPIIEISNRL